MSAEAEAPDLRKAFVDPMLDANGVTVNSLGICSALAVTTQFAPSLTMAVSVTVVIAASNLVISCIRKLIPGSVRMIIQLVVVATMVILVDQVLKAYAYNVSKSLSVFVGLIITNCIVMGRLEAYAMHNPPIPSLLDGLGSGIGYGMVIVTIGFFRELLGQGTLSMPWRDKPYAIVETLGLESWGYQNNGLMVIGPGAFLMLGLLVWGHRTWNKSLVEKE